MMMTKLIFKRFTVGGYGINGFLVADPDTRIGVFIDPGGFCSEIETFIKEKSDSTSIISLLHMDIGTILKALLNLTVVIKLRVMPDVGRSVESNTNYKEEK